MRNGSDLTPPLPLARGRVIIEQAIRIDPAEVLADELVGLAIVDTFLDEAPLGWTHLLLLGLPPNGGIPASAKQAIPETGHGHRV